jgi:hypothetical protein
MEEDFAIYRDGANVKVVSVNSQREVYVTPQGVWISNKWGNVNSPSEIPSATEKFIPW